MSGRARAIVLVVDDSPATLGVLNQALDAAGYTVLVAQDGTAALALVARVTPDIVLMDALMPGLDGFETCRRMKRVPGVAAVPIVFMTGLTDTEHVIRGLEAGGVDYVTKPVAPDEVIARMEVHLANARLTRSAQGALDAAGRFLLAVDRAGRVLWSTPQATRLLEEAGGSGAALPPEVAAWVVQRDPAALSFGSVAGGPAAERLEVSYVGQIGPDELLLRLVAGSCRRGRGHPAARRFAADSAGGGGAAVDQPGQVQPGRGGDPGAQPAHGEQAPGAGVREAGSGEPVRGDGAGDWRAAGAGG